MDPSLFRPSRPGQLELPPYLKDTLTRERRACRFTDSLVTRVKLEDCRHEEEEAAGQLEKGVDFTCEK